VAEYGLLLNESPLKGKASFDHILRQARDAQGEDPFGYRKHFIRLVEKTRALQ
jgi:Ca-activated chloride channel family protein